MKCPKSGDLKSEIQNPKNAINGKRATESPRKQTEEKNKTEDEPEAKCERGGETRNEEHAQTNGLKVQFVKSRFFSLIPNLLNTLGW